DFFDGDFSLGSNEKSINEKRLCEIQEGVLKQYFAQLNLRNKLRPIFAIAGGTVLQMIDRSDPIALKAKLQGVLSAEEILSTLKFTGVEQWVVKKICDWIQSMKGRREVLELFTEVISGSSTLPLNRDKDYMKVRMFRQGRVMTIDTCFNMLCLTGDREKKENINANLDWLLKNIEQLNRSLLKLFGRN
ncbi:MAG: hypothetical protein KDK40_05570, partial [Chlamydiia bacterium]|nr:hypothetical protein [Chlamydiia bacterium]